MEASHGIKEVKVEDEATKQFCLLAERKKHGLYRISPFNQIHQKGYLKLHEIYQRFEIHQDDVWICTFPKSGMKRNDFIICSVTTVRLFFYERKKAGYFSL